MDDDDDDDSPARVHQPHGLGNEPTTTAVSFEQRRLERQLYDTIRASITKQGTANATTPLPPPRAAPHVVVPPRLDEARRLLHLNKPEAAMQVVLKALNDIGGDELVKSAVKKASGEFWSSQHEPSTSHKESKKRKIEDLVGELEHLLRSCSVESNVDEEDYEQDGAMMDVVVDEQAVTPTTSPTGTKRVRMSHGVKPEYDHDESTVFTCERCGAVIALSRRLAHETMWCSAL